MSLQASLQCLNRYSQVFVSPEPICLSEKSGLLDETPTASVSRAALEALNAKKARIAAATGTISVLLPEKDLEASSGVMLIGIGVILPLMIWVGRAGLPIWPAPAALPLAPPVAALPPAPPVALPALVAAMPLTPSEPRWLEGK